MDNSEERIKSSFENLDVWKEGIRLTTEIYTLTKHYPKEELYGIVNQLKRAAVSISSNIAEDSGRKHTREFIQFLYISRGSIFEIITLLFISKNQNYISTNDFTRLNNSLNILTRRVASLINKLESKLPNPNNSLLPIIN